MARSPRPQFEGAVYHLIVRGNNRRPLFQDSQDKGRFLELLIRYQDRFGYWLYAYILLNNHLRLLVETPRGNVSRVMQCLGTSYASYFNRKYRRRGTLFEGRYKSYLVSKADALSEHTRVIHRFCFQRGLRDGGSGYPWSSYRVYLGMEESAFVETATVLKRFGDRPGEQQSRYREFVEKWEVRKGHAADGEDLQGMAPSACPILPKPVPPAAGRFRSEASAMIQAEDIIQRVSVSLGLNGTGELRKKRRKSLARHLTMYLIRKQTPLPLRAIGTLLGVKAPAVVIAVRKIEEMIEKGAVPSDMESLLGKSELVPAVR